MAFVYADYKESADYLRARIGDFVPKTLMVLGSGLGFMGDVVEDPVAVPYGDIPHFKPSTAPGHKGQLVFGTLRGCPVAVMQGRMHHYEGYSYEEVAYAVRVLKLLGAETMIVTNAAGCVNTQWNVGELMLITDHIKIFMESPLQGTNVDEFGPRFPDATHLYTPALREVAREKAKALGVTLRDARRGAAGPDPGRGRGGDVHRPRGHRGGALRHEGVGFHPPFQYGRGHLGPAPHRVGGTGRGGGGQGQIFCLGAGLPGSDVRRARWAFYFPTLPPF